MLWYFYFVMMSIVSGAVLDPSFKEEFNNRVSLQHLKQIKQDLQAELKSLISPIDISTTNEKKPLDPLKTDELIILPSNLLSSNIFEKLGWDFLNTDSYSFSLNDSEFKIPKEFKNLFLFNTTQPLAIPSSKHHNFARFLDESLPFNLPGYMNLMDHYLVLPKKYVQQKMNVAQNDTSCLFNEGSVFSRSIVTSPVSQLPIFRSVISENKPLMVFMFSDSNFNTFQKLKNPIMNIMNYLKPEKFIFSNFFDTFANDWIKNINYESLVSSVFCTTNSNNLTDSYCLQVFDKKALFLFPAFYDVSQLIHLSKFGGVNESPKAIGESKESQEARKETKESQEDSKAINTSNQVKRDSNEVDAQAIRQVHDKLSLAVDKVNDVTYEFATEPKQLVERVDETLDSKRYKFMDKLDEKKDRIEDKKDALIGKLNGGVDALKSKLGVVKTLQTDDYDLGDQEYSVKDNLINKRELTPIKRDTAKRDSVKRDFEEEEQALLPFQPEGGFILPLSLIRAQEHYTPTPRSKSYSQVLFETIESIEDRHKFSKRFSIFSNDDNCEKITWYNVFHHSIFGKPRFCLDK